MPQASRTPARPTRFARLLTDEEIRPFLAAADENMLASPNSDGGPFDKGEVLPYHVLADWMEEEGDPRHELYRSWAARAEGDSPRKWLHGVTHDLGVGEEEAYAHQNDYHGRRSWGDWTVRSMSHPSVGLYHQIGHFPSRVSDPLSYHHYGEKSFRHEDALDFADRVSHSDPEAGERLREAIQSGRGLYELHLDTLHAQAGEHSHAFGRDGKRYKYAREVPVSELHPELRFTRLGAVLRHLVRTGDHADLAVAIADGVIQDAGPHDGPMNLVPLHVLRDYMLENPEHELAKKFNWEKLPEKVELDRTMRQELAANGRVGELQVTPMLLRIPSDPRLHQRIVGIRNSIKAKHPWVYPRDITESASRVDDQVHRTATASRRELDSDQTAINRPDLVHHDLAHRDTSGPEDPKRYARKFARVEDSDAHPDYKPTGIAPRIGHALHRLAAEGEGRLEPAHASLAEAILRTGDHSVLPILADALEEAGHPLLHEFDWRHAPRAIEIDRALHHEIGRHIVSQVSPTHAQFDNVPLTPNRVHADWRNGARGRVSKRRALKAVRSHVQDAKPGDVVHSLLRLADNAIDLTRVPEIGVSLVSRLPSELPKWLTSMRAEHAKELGGVPVNPHRYPDTRPQPKGRKPRKQSREKFAAANEDDIPTKVANKARTPPAAGGKYDLMPDTPAPKRVGDRKAGEFLSREQRLAALEASAKVLAGKGDHRAPIAEANARRARENSARWHFLDHAVKLQSPDAVTHSFGSRGGRGGGKVSFFPFHSPLDGSPMFHVRHEDGFSTMAGVLDADQAMRVARSMPAHTDEERASAEHAAARVAEHAFAGPRRYDRAGNPTKMKAEVRSGLAQAIARLHSGTEKAFRETLAEVLNRTRLTPHKIHEVLHDTPHNVKPSVAASILRNVGDDQAQYAAAWHGLLTNQPAVLLFRSHPEGEDSVYRLKLPQKPEQIRGMLDKLGFRSRLLIPKKAHTEVVLHDPGRKNRKGVARLADKLKVGVEEVTGFGKVLGGRDAEAAREAYRNVTREFESGGKTKMSRDSLREPSDANPTQSDHQAIINSMIDESGDGFVDDGHVAAHTDALEEMGHRGLANFLRSSVFGHGIKPRVTDISASPLHNTQKFADQNPDAFVVRYFDQNGENGGKTHHLRAYFNLRGVHPRGAAVSYDSPPMTAQEATDALRSIVTDYDQERHTFNPEYARMSAYIRQLRDTFDAN